MEYQNILQISFSSNPTKTNSKYNLEIISLQAQTWKTETDEMQVSYDVAKLYLSIHIYKLTHVILQQLSEHYEDLKTRTKLKLRDVQQLIEFCVSECYFLSDNVIWILL